MRNKYPGKCYRCGEIVRAQEGHFERHGRGWRTQHATCAIAHRGTDHKFGKDKNSALATGEDQPTT